METYIDKYGRYHDKKVTIENPIPSNNSWIYSAYAAKAGLPVDKQKLYQCMYLCRTENGSFLRSPGKDTPPISRDEILGLVYLDLAYYSTDWNFSPYQLPKFSLIKLVKQLSQLITTKPMSAEGSWSHLVGPFYTKHRNYFWQNNLDQLYRFTFSVPIQDRHFILKHWGKFQWYNPVHLFYAGVAKIDSMLPKKSGIKWLKYGGEENKKAMVLEFPEDHPIRTRLGL